ncbi:MAG TPA: glycosyltransferase [Tepidisphaeraceae bacterium]|nr:glycosyltransferase [Tepidisphaeraceae bacterium]
MAIGNGKVPAISVVMPVYNTEAYLAPAIESILAQTFGDYEFIILDDGSTDSSVHTIQQYAEHDERIRFFPLEHRGYVSLLRRGLNHCRGEFVARMDSDDISTPDRFEKQVAHLRQHTDVVALGSRVCLIDPFGSQFEKPAHKLHHAEIEAELLNGVGWAIVHPTVMMRRDALMKVGGYREDLMVSEDLDLFLRLAEVGKLANLPDVLLQYRQHLGSVNFTKYEQQKAVKRQIVADAYKRRGMPMPANWAFRERKLLPHPEQYRRWGWAALRSGNLSVARRHAISAIRQAPLSMDTWRLTVCALRGR